MIWIRKLLCMLIINAVLVSCSHVDRRAPIKPIGYIDKPKYVTSVFQGFNGNDNLVYIDNKYMHIFSDLSMNNSLLSIDLKGVVQSIKSAYIDFEELPIVKQGAYVAFITSDINQSTLYLYQKNINANYYNQLFEVKTDSFDILGFVSNSNNLYLITNNNSTIELYSDSGKLYSTYNISKDSIVSNFGTNNIIKNTVVYDGENINILVINNNQFVLKKTIFITKNFILSRLLISDYNDSIYYCNDYIYVYSGYELYFISLINYKIFYSKTINLYRTNGINYYLTDKGFLYIDAIYNYLDNTYDLYTITIPTISNIIFSYSDCKNNKYGYVTYNNTNEFAISNIQIQTNKNSQNINIFRSYYFKNQSINYYIDRYEAYLYIILGGNIYDINNNDFIDKSYEIKPNRIILK